MSEPRIHIYSTTSQPMTRYVDDFASPKFSRVIKHKPLEIFYCANCRKRRQAKNLRIQIYYDSSHIFCADKDKCKKER